MINELSQLFAPTYAEARRPTSLGNAPANSSTTSKQATDSLRPDVGGLEGLTLRIIASSGDQYATNKEVSEVSSRFGRYMPVATLCPRTNALARWGLIINSVLRRPGASGVACTIWVLADVDRRDGT